MPEMLKTTAVIARREFAAYFATPLAYVFIVIFLVLSGVFTFYLGGFFEGGQANLSAFFNFHPWLYLFLVPAIAMRLWAEERKSGSIELLMTLPITRFEAVTGKFLAAWVFSGIALALTFPMWFTVNYLGNPDNGVILAGYLGSFFMAGGYLAIGSCLSAVTRNQVIAFVVSVAVSFLFTVSGLPIVIDFFETKLDAWRQVVRNPQFERLPLLLLHRRLENRADSRMITVSHPPDHIGEVLIGQPCGIGQGRNQLADQRPVGIVFLELDPGGFRRFGAQIVHQPAGAFRAHDRVKGHGMFTF
jgi:ABC-2 type transport system permease protein